MNLKKIVPNQFHSLVDNPVLSKIVKNINWLTFEKVFRLVIGLVVYAVMARYLGPEQFGVLNYALAFAGLFLALNTLGLDSITVRNIVNEPKKAREYLGSTLVLRLVGSIILIVLSSIAIYFVRPDNTLLLFFVIIIATGYFFKSFETIDLWFQSEVKSKYTVFARSIAFFIVSGLKLLFVFTQQPLIAFVLMFALDSVISAILLIFYYKYVEKHSIFNWKPRFQVMKELLKDSWPLILSGIAVMIYMRIDQIMIGSMLSDQAVGIYSAAVKLSETWYFLPMIITASVFPAILNARKKSKELYLKRIQTLYDVFTWFTISVALVVTFLSPFIIHILYGSEFSDAATVLSIHIWAGVFVFLGVASSKYLVAENLTKISFYRTFAGGFINIILNLFLIPMYGIIGAAIATLFSQMIAVMLLFFFKNGRTVGIQILNSFNFLTLLRRLL